MPLFFIYLFFFFLLMQLFYNFLFNIQSNAGYDWPVNQNYMLPWIMEVNDWCPKYIYINIYICTRNVQFITKHYQKYRVLLQSNITLGNKITKNIGAMC